MRELQFNLKNGAIISRLWQRPTLPPQQIELIFPMPMGAGLWYHPHGSTERVVITFWLNAAYENIVEYAELEPQRDSEPPSSAPTNNPM